MMRFVRLPGWGRPIRGDEIADLGRPTGALAREAIGRGDLDEACELLAYLPVEEKFVYDLNRDDVWAWMTWMAERWGEDENFRLCWALFTSEGARQARRRIRALPVEEQVAWCAEMMRGHRSGAGDAGEVEVTEEADRFVISFDPCGSGGRMRRGDAAGGTPPRTQPPFNYGVTKAPYDWSWSEVGVCYYCAHCAIYNELTGIAEYGTPNWVTEYPRNPDDSCRFVFYKRPELIPDRYYRQVRRVKPAAAPKAAPAGLRYSDASAAGLRHSEGLGRVLRLEDRRSLGESTLGRMLRHLEDGKTAEALALLDYYETYEETYHLGGGWRQLDVAAYVADRAGEAAVGEFLRATAGSWMRGHVERLAALSPRERLYFLAELKRAECRGPGGDATLRVSEEWDRFLVEADPCGDCGRLRRLGQGADGMVPRLGVTTRQHPWAWGQVGVPFRCARACVAFELLPLEWTGAPLWVTDWSPDPQAPCRISIYKQGSLIPDVYFDRLGHRAGT